MEKGLHTDNFVFSFRRIFPLLFSSLFTPHLRRDIMNGFWRGLERARSMMALVSSILRAWVSFEGREIRLKYLWFDLWRDESGFRSKRSFSGWLINWTMFFGEEFFIRIVLFGFDFICEKLRFYYKSKFLVKFLFILWLERESIIPFFLYFCKSWILYSSNSDICILLE